MAIGFNRTIAMAYICHNEEKQPLFTHSSVVISGTLELFLSCDRYQYMSAKECPLDQDVHFCIDCYYLLIAAIQVNVHCHLKHNTDSEVKM